MTTGSQTPARAPSELLCRTEFVTACAARDFGAVFHLLRKYAGISQVRIAAAVDMTPSRVGEVIRGQREITSLDVVERISDRLRIPGGMLGLAARAWESADGPCATSQPIAMTDIGAILGDGELDVTADGAVRLAAEWLAVEPPQSAELRAGPQVGSGLVARIEARTHHLRRMDDFVGGRDSLPVVVGEVDVTAALIRKATTNDETRSRLLAALAELCQLAGWVLDDAGRPEQAARYYVAGARAADVARERGIAANLLSTLSYSLANNGRERDAVLLARSAALAGSPHAAPLGRALLWDRVAWAHARTGDEQACLRALDAADEAFGRSPGDEVPEWAYWLDRRELDVMAGRCFTQLDRPVRAEPLLRDAVARYDASHSREVALYRSWLAEAYAKRGDVDAACAETMAVLDALEAVNSARVDDRVTVLRRALHRYADVPAVRDVEDRSRALLRSA